MELAPRVSPPSRVSPNPPRTSVSERDGMLIFKGKVQGGARRSTYVTVIAIICGLSFVGVTLIAPNFLDSTAASLLVVGFLTAEGYLVAHWINFCLPGATMSQSFIVDPERRVIRIKVGKLEFSPTFDDVSGIEINKKHRLLNPGLRFPIYRAEHVLSLMFKGAFRPCEIGIVRKPFDMGGRLAKVFGIPTEPIFDADVPVQGFSYRSSSYETHDIAWRRRYPEWAASESGKLLDNWPEYLHLTSDDVERRKGIDEAINKIWTFYVENLPSSTNAP
jgi:hypothetical protein